MKRGPTIHRRVLDSAYMDIDTLYRDFHISEQGYNEEQAEESRIQYGKNILSGRASDTVLYRLRRAFINPFTVILFFLAVISFLTDVVMASNFSRNITTAAIILCSFEFFPQHPAQGRFQFFLPSGFQNRLHHKGAFLPFRHTLQDLPRLLVIFVLQVGAEHK